MWETLFKRYWQVTILKESPENTPYSPILLAIISFLFALLIILQWYLADIKQAFDPAVSALASVILLSSYFAYTYVLLAIYRKANRVLQTLTSLLVGHMIVHIFAFPLLIVTPMLINSDMNQVVALLIGVVYLIFTFLLTLWQFFVTMHIYKYSLDVDYLSAALASFGLLACNVLAVSFWQSG